MFLLGQIFPNLQSVALYKNKRYFLVACFRSNRHRLVDILCDQLSPKSAPWKMPNPKEPITLKHIGFNRIIGNIRRFGNFDQCSLNLQRLREFYLI